jgi:uncharacterized protein (TIGR02680 family)
MTEQLIAVPAPGKQRPANLPVPATVRWQLLRVGIEGLWEYPAGTRFVTAGGWLHFRGRNESGKSKAIELALPATLDGRLASERLDPHGSTSRPMRYNLVGPHLPEGRRKAVGYAFSEFGRVVDGEPEFFTCGYGVTASRGGSGHTGWWFTLAGRVDVDVDLTPQRTPLTDTGLGGVLADVPDGSVHGLEAHRTKVAEVLFGVSTARFDELMTLLLQLRTPQLGKKLDVASLSEKLAEAMPEIDTLLIGEAASSFQQLEDDRAHLKELHVAQDHLQAFTTSYREYLRTAVARDAAVASSARRTQTDITSQHRLLSQRLTPAELRTLARQRRRAQDLRLAKRSVPLLESRLERAEATDVRNTGESRRLKAHLQSLQLSDEWAGVQKLAEARKRLTDVKDAAERAKGELETARGRDREARRLAARRQDEHTAAVRDRDQALVRLRIAGEPLGLNADVDTAASAFDNPDTAASAVGSLEAALAGHQDVLQQLSAAAGKVAGAADRLDSAEELLRQAGREVIAATDERDDAVTKYETAVRTWEEQALRWAATLQALPAGDVADMVSGHGHADVRDGLAPLVQRVRGDIDAAVDDAAAAVRDLSGSVETCEDELAEAESDSDPVPPGAPWRRGPQPGMPLYLLVDPGPSLDPDEEAGLEGAMAAAGLLDAHVRTDGTLIAADGTLVVGRTAPVNGPSLADVLDVTSSNDVPPEAVRDVLRCVSTDTSGDAPLAVGTDGTFRSGPLTGRNAAKELRYLGTAARQRTRLLTIERLRAELEQLRGDLERAKSRHAAAAGRRSTLESELASLPSSGQIVQAEARVGALNGAVGRAEKLKEERAGKVARAKQERQQAKQELDTLASDLGAGGWVDRLATYQQRVEDVDGQLRTIRTLVGEATARQQRSTDAAEHAVQAGGDLEAATSRCTAAQGRLQDLQGAIGGLENLVAGGDIIEKVTEVDQRIEHFADASRKIQRAIGKLRSGLDEQRGRLEASHAAVEKADRDALAAVGDLRRHLDAGRLELVFDAGVLSQVPPEEWTPRTARDLTTAVIADVDPSLSGRPVSVQTAELSSRRDMLAERVPGHFLTLDRHLRPTYRPVQDVADGVLRFVIPSDGVDVDVLLFEQQLDAEVEVRAARIDDADKELLERFLAGEVRTNLADTMRAAQKLFSAISDKLSGLRTNSGKRVRLSRSERDEHRDVIDLLLRGPAARAEQDDNRLREFMSSQLAQARVAVDDPTLPAATLQQQLAQRLDYRTWFEFTVQVSDPDVDDGAWRKLTTRTHGAGSGGSKSMLLHLPLIAALAAWYDSANVAGPRLAVLDEAFAGIDAGVVAEILALVADLDFDLVTTSHDEWFMTPDVSALAVYDLDRDPEAHVVDFDRYVWDGRMRTQIA